jgi:hypothetical protein
MTFNRFQSDITKKDDSDNKEIDFKVIGLDDNTSKFINWALSQRNNIEYLRECGILMTVSNSVTMHFDHLGVIKRIDTSIRHERT